jgi:RNA polymerase sigma-70 factor (ECF subfamily)
MADQNLINRILEGDQSAFEVIYKQYRSEFLSWIRNNYTMTETDAQELYQESCLLLYKNIMSRKLITLTGSMKTYLFGIGKNKAMELYRKKNRELKKEQELKEQFEADVDDPLEENEDMINGMMKCMEDLGEGCKRILNAFYFLEMSMDDIADAYEYKNAATVKNLKYKCILQLRGLFTRSKMRTV